MLNTKWHSEMGLYLNDIQKYESNLNQIIHFLSIYYLQKSQNIKENDIFNILNILHTICGTSNVCSELIINAYSLLMILSCNFLNNNNNIENKVLSIIDKTIRSDIFTYLF